MKYDTVSVFLNLKQVADLDLPECAEIRVYDGDSTESPLLDVITQANNPQTVISTGNVMFLFYRTCDMHALDRRGFRLRYISGCYGSIMADAGYVTSPGFLAGEEYPNFQVCEWMVRSVSGEPLSLRFVDPFDLEDDLDFLTVRGSHDDTV